MKVSDLCAMYSLFFLCVAIVKTNITSQEELTPYKGELWLHSEIQHVMLPTKFFSFFFRAAAKRSKTSSCMHSDFPEETNAHVPMAWPV